jgi:hypothetical protein
MSAALCRVHARSGVMTAAQLQCRQALWFKTAFIMELLWFLTPDQWVITSGVITLKFWRGIVSQIG